MADNKEERIASTRLRSIDCLRALASLSVLLHHAINYPEAGGPSNGAPVGKAAWFDVTYFILHHCSFGVPLFFAVSGFCIHARWAKQYAQDGFVKINFVDFWKRRAYRLFPPYIIALCLSMSLLLAAYLMGKQTNTLVNYPGDNVLRWLGIDFLAHLTMTHGFHPSLWKAGGNASYWTLAIEEQFYLLYFVLLGWRRWTGPIGSMTFAFLLGLGTIGFMYTFDPSSPWRGLIQHSGPAMLIQFALGMLAAEAYWGVVKLPRWTSWGALVPLWGIAGFWCDEHFPLLGAALTGMCFFTVLNWCIVRERTVGFNENRVTRYLSHVGVFSYSLFLVHMPVRSALKHLLGSHVITDDPVKYMLISLGLATAGYYAGRVFFRLVESRFLNKGTSLKKGAAGATKTAASVKTQAVTEAPVAPATGFASPAGMSEVGPLAVTKLDVPPARSGFELPR